MTQIEHGTSAGYQRCKKLYGTACKRCLEAEAEYMKEWRKKNGNAAKLLREKANIRQKAKTILSHRHREEYLEIVKELEG